MHREDTNREAAVAMPPDRERAIWSFDCLMICACLGFGLREKEIGKLCHYYELVPKDRTVDPGYGFFRLHHSCHNRNLLTKKLTKLFDRRYRLTIEKIRGTAMDNERDWNDLVAGALETGPMPVLWALLTDPRPEARHYGVYLAHTSAMKAFRAYDRAGRRHSAGGPDSPRPVNDFGRLKRDAARLSREKQRLAGQLAKSRSVNEKLSSRLDRLTSRIADLEERPSREAKLERELRKTRYELEKLKAAGGDRPTGTAADPPAPEEARPPKVGRVDSPAAPDEDPVHCPLEGLKVAVVGGLDRMEPRYARLVRDLGASFLFHDGKCRNGTCTLKNMVCNADIVVFITSCNSHPALQAVRAACRKTGKSFYALKQTGVDPLKEVLLRAVS